MMTMPGNCVPNKMSSECHNQPPDEFGMLHNFAVADIIGIPIISEYYAHTKNTVLSDQRHTNNGRPAYTNSFQGGRNS